MRAFALLLLSSPVYAATYCVTNTDDPGTVTPADCSASCATSTCSLREALAATVDGGNSADTITFAVPAASGAIIISASLTFPTGQGPVVIDGFSQPGAQPSNAPTGSNAVLGVRIACASPSVDAVAIAGDGVQMRGVIIGNCGTAVTISGSGTFLTENFLGSDGTTTLPLVHGLVHTGGANNVIGPGNLVAGCSNLPIDVQAAQSVLLDGNFIGTNASLTAALGNAKPVRVSGNVLVHGNVIAGSGTDGLLVDASDATVTMTSNVIGHDGADHALPNLRDGIRVSAVAGSGFVELDSNWIAHNGGGGINVNNTTPIATRMSANVIYGNAGPAIERPDAFTGVVAPVLAGPALAASGVQFQIGATGLVAGDTYTVELFTAQACTGDVAETRAYLGSVDFIAGAATDYTLTALGPARAGDVATTTLTHHQETSVLSVCAPIVSHGAISFEHATYSSSASAGSVEVKVLRSGGTLGAVSALVTAGAFTQTVSFADADASAQSVRVPFTAGDQALAIALSAFTGGAYAGDIVSAVLTVTPLPPVMSAPSGPIDDSPAETPSPVAKTGCRCQSGGFDPSLLLAFLFLARRRWRA